MFLFIYNIWGLKTKILIGHYNKKIIKFASYFTQLYFYKITTIQILR